jgi:hypothetical protein
MASKRDREAYSPNYRARVISPGNARPTFCRVFFRSAYEARVQPAAIEKALLCRGAP